MDLPPGIKWYGYQLVDNYLRLGVELWGRSWNNASESFRQTFNELGRSVVQPRSVEHLFRTVLREYSNFVTGMIMVLPLAADSAAARTDSARRTFAPENPVAMDGGAPLVTGAIHELPGKGTDAEKTPFVT